MAGAAAAYQEAGQAKPRLPRLMPIKEKTFTTKTRTDVAVFHWNVNNAIGRLRTKCEHF